VIVHYSGGLQTGRPGFDSQHDIISLFPGTLVPVQHVPLALSAREGRSVLTTCKTTRRHNPKEHQSTSSLACKIFVRVHCTGCIKLWASGVRVTLLPQASYYFRIRNVFVIMVVQKYAILQQLQR
jgi:hypothetical protein